ncbi:uncharacterized protein F4807DRAFT_130020 [Annulohypoxylon truncatum]|uniref:uncharacterized protein n=1 Tax=Annulohypoxylon truncatum TaxID=327061 RepID=UPI002007FC43|nr:uncharacterized protein F4807DRAFT_130020 [Annulohypoxylon truncatum]KAI1214492.1 hypothetical protein F4807DRAFT_130020 [Annulohypoxylon truncatum]
MSEREKRRMQFEPRREHDNELHETWVLRLLLRSSRMDLPFVRLEPLAPLVLAFALARLLRSRTYSPAHLRIRFAFRGLLGCLCAWFMGSQFRVLLNDCGKNIIRCDYIVDGAMQNLLKSVICTTLMISQLFVDEEPDMTIGCNWCINTCLIQPYKTLFLLNKCGVETEHRPRLSGFSSSSLSCRVAIPKGRG